MRRDEFRRHGLLGAPVVLEHRDVVKDGFGGLSDIDSVFLDLPAPWDALPHAKKILDVGPLPSPHHPRLTSAQRRHVSRVCCFSPCIEQVQRTVSTLNSLGFSDICMYETLVRTHESVTIHQPTVDEAVARIKDVEVRKEGRRQRQISEAKRKREAKEAERNEAEEAEATDDEPSPKKARINGDVPADQGLADAVFTEAGPSDPVPPPPVNDALAASAEVDPVMAILLSLNPTRPIPTPSAPAAPTSSLKPNEPKVFHRTNTNASRPVPHVRGHTSFLTFAALLPDLVGTLVADGAVESGANGILATSEVATGVDDTDLAASDATAVPAASSTIKEGPLNDADLADFAEAKAASGLAEAESSQQE